jgi:hypothetical protein
MVKRWEGHRGLLTIHATRRARCRRAAPGSLEIIDLEADERENPLTSEQLFTTAAAKFHPRLPIPRVTASVAIQQPKSRTFSVLTSFAN